MDDDLLYVVRRTFGDDEYDNYVHDMNTRYYGWTDDINVIKAFFLQRNPEKYDYYTMTKKEAERLYSFPQEDDLFTKDKKIDILYLPTKKSDKLYPLYTTMDEILETKHSLRLLFEESCSFKNIDDNILPYIWMMTELKMKYSNALYNIKFIPDEIETFYDVPPRYQELYSIEDLLPFITNLETYMKVMMEDM